LERKVYLTMFEGSFKFSEIRGNDKPDLDVCPLFNVMKERIEFFKGHFDIIAWKNGQLHRFIDLFCGTRADDE